MYLEGKRVIITGGSSGIGLATAQAMTAVGAKVFITGRRPDVLAKAVDQLRATHAEASGVAADVATNDGRATTLKAGLENLGGLDILEGRTAFHLLEVRFGDLEAGLRAFHLGGEDNRVDLGQLGPLFVDGPFPEIRVEPDDFTAENL